MTSHSPRSLPEIKIDDQCSICTEPLCSLIESERRMLFICHQCKNSWIHFSCAKSLVKIDRVESRLPLRCPFCRNPYSNDEISSLLPPRRKLTFTYCAQPFDENSIFEIKVVEHYDDRSYVSDDPFQEQHDFRQRRLRSREALTCRFNGSYLPKINNIYFPVQATQKIELPPLNSSPGCLFIPVVQTPQQQQQQEEEEQQSLRPLSETQPQQQQQPSDPEEREEEIPDQQELISPVRKIIRTQVMAEKAIEDLKNSISEMEVSKNNHRMITRSMSRKNCRRRRHSSPLDKMKARIKIMRKLCSGLNSDLIDLLMSSSR